MSENQTVDVEGGPGAQRLLDEIDELTARNRAEPDPERERRLISLRNEAFEAFDGDEASGEWPRPTPDLFPDIDGPPEVAAADLTYEHIGSAIQHHGALIVRGLIPQPHLPGLIAHIDGTFDAAETYFEHPDRRDELVAWFEPFFPPGVKPTLRDRLFTLKHGGVFAADSPRTFFHVMNMLDEVGVTDLVTRHLGARPAIARDKASVIRRPKTAETGWHQDGSFLGERSRTVNLWATFSDCGVDAPGLEYVPRRFDTLLDGLAMDDALIQRVLAETPAVQPAFAAGDAMFFDNLFLHRTGIRGEMKRARHGIEWWYFAPHAYPQGWVGLAV